MGQASPKGGGRSKARAGGEGRRGERASDGASPVGVGGTDEPGGEPKGRGRVATPLERVPPQEAAPTPRHAAGARPAYRAGENTQTPTTMRRRSRKAGRQKQGGIKVVKKGRIGTGTRCFPPAEGWGGVGARWFRFGFLEKYRSYTPYLTSNLLLLC